MTHALTVSKTLDRVSRETTFRTRVSDGHASACRSKIPACPKWAVCGTALPQLAAATFSDRFKRQCRTGNRGTTISACRSSQAERCRGAGATSATPASTQQRVGEDTLAAERCAGRNDDWPVTSRPTRLGAPSDRSASSISGDSGLDLGNATWLRSCFVPPRGGGCASAAVDLGEAGQR